jgi:predicted anti-sigma-YlaC factor YlaD
MSELVTDYMERTTSFQTRAGMWWHLWRCEACRRYFDQVRRTVTLLGSDRPPLPVHPSEEGLLAVARAQRHRDP